MRQAVRLATVLAIAGLAAAPATAAFAQPKPGSERGLGLTGADIPPLLQAVQADPYRAPAEPACETIPQEIMALDEVLGPDVDTVVKTRTSDTVVRMVGGAVRGLIPYRGWVRFVTQAGAKDRKLQNAATAGYARRGFLRGLEANLQCAPKAVQARAIVADTASSGDRIAAQMVSEPAAAGAADRAAPLVDPPGRPVVATLVSDPRR